MRDQHAREIRADFGRVNAAGDEDDRFSLLDQFCCFVIARGEWAERAWIGELILDLSEVVEMREIRGRADRGHDERLAHRPLSESLKSHAIAGLVESLEV